MRRPLDLFFKKVLPDVRILFIKPLFWKAISEQDDSEAVRKNGANGAETRPC